MPARSPTWQAGLRTPVDPHDTFLARTHEAESPTWQTRPRAIAQPPLSSPQQRGCKVIASIALQRHTVEAEGHTLRWLTIHLPQSQYPPSSLTSVIKHIDGIP